MNRINDFVENSNPDIKNIILYENKLHYIYRELDIHYAFGHNYFFSDIQNTFHIINCNEIIDSLNVNLYNYYLSKHKMIVPYFYNKYLEKIQLNIQLNTYESNFTSYDYKFSEIFHFNILFYKNISENEFLIVTDEKEIIIFNVNEICISQVKKIDLKIISNNYIRQIIDIVYTNNKIIVFLHEKKGNEKSKTRYKYVYMVINLNDDTTSKNVLKDKPGLVIKLSDEIILVSYDQVFSENAKYEIIYFPDINYFNTSSKKYFDNCKDIYFKFN